MSLRREMAPRAPGAPVTAAAWSALTVVRWPVVAGAGGVSAFLVLCLTTLVWAELSPRRNTSSRSGPGAEPAAAAAAATKESQSRQDLTWEASGTQEESPEEEGLTTYEKAPASPALAGPSEAQWGVVNGWFPAERPGANQDTPDRSHGTAVAFARSPVEAARQALAERKLLFTLHLSGHFEDPGFT